MLKNLDFFGPGVEFKINNSSSLKSEFGGLTSIFVFFVSILAFIGFGYDLFRRESPTVMMNRVLSENTSYTITDSNFLFAVYDQFSDKAFPELDRKFRGSLDFIEFFGDGNSARKKYFF